MKEISLDGNWNLKVLGENTYGIGEEEIPAKVPGSVYGTLMEQGRIPDIFYRDNELQATKLMENDFEYSRSFYLEEEEMQGDGVLLRFEGIDTLADIYVNGQFTGAAYNMHRVWEFDVSEVLKDGENTLRVVLHSPIRYIREENEKVYTGGSADAMEGFPHLRKAHCMFGWDWGPRLPDAGIFRSVKLVVVQTARIEQVYISQIHEEGKVILDFDTTIELFSGAEEVTERVGASTEERVKDRIKIKVYSPEGEEYLPDEEEKVVIKTPKLWWPNGYGEQPLYRAEVVLLDDKGEILDKWCRRIGLRTVTVNTEKDEWGNCFAHEVNGIKIFAMGADYIPEDNVCSRITKERTRKLLEDCVAANHNCIRVWGGGYYPDDYFFDICDELGLLVWQDFMYACASYELDDAFEENIRQETIENVRRIRHHACLGLWCGNNEMETQTLDKVWRPSEKQKYDYIKLFEYIIPKIVKEEDPNTFYWPSSPSSGGNFENPWNENVGDTHYWDVWHGDKPFTEYRKFYFRYLSEFGFQSFPCLKTVETFTEPEDRNIFSRIMEMHQRNRAANGKILNYLSATYLYPKDFDHMLYASQLLQADAIRYGVEHFRRHRGRCMGTVVWQLNDIWPVASWAGIDYYGRWKALHYVEKRMFAPVMISCEERGELTERPYCIMEKQEFEKSVRIHVANETREAAAGEVYAFLRDAGGKVLWEKKETVTVPPLSGIWLEKQEFPDCDIFTQYVSYEFRQKGQVISEGTCLFTTPKHFRFQNPKLSYRIEGDSIVVSAESYAQKVEVEGTDGDVRLEDNYFDLNAGERKVRIIEGNASSYRVRSVYDISR
ncbi:MAG: glycoside hydrolase family 2 protein [Lachnospiraceae bacterium]|nr:glycoside hydrolase family 2 protein [Lachnospiraceae bacterium]